MDVIYGAKSNEFFVDILRKSGLFKIDELDFH